VPPPTTPGSLRKYDAKEAALVQQAAAPKKESSMVSAAAVPLFGVVAMFTFVAFVSTRARGQSDEEAFMSDVSAAE